MSARLPLPKRNRRPLGGVCEQNSRSQRRPQGWGGLREKGSPRLGSRWGG